MGKQRIIKFNLEGINKNILHQVGIYKIVNTINNHFYVGSTDRSFIERFKEHCRYYEQHKTESKRVLHPALWAAYDKYGIENFKVEIIEILTNKTYYEILEKEEYYIHTLNPEYNISRYPTSAGKPNLGKKLSKEWREKIRKKSLKYKHSKDTLKVVSDNNKRNAIKLKFENDLNILNFNSWVEAAKYFNTSESNLQNAYKRHKKYKDWNIFKLSSQKKKIQIFINNEILEFDSYSKCDKHFNMWKGYTSTIVNTCKLNFLNKYKYKLI